MALFTLPVASDVVPIMMHRVAKVIYSCNSSSFEIICVKGASQDTVLSVAQRQNSSFYLLSGGHALLSGGQNAEAYLLESMEVKNETAGQ